MKNIIVSKESRRENENMELERFVYISPAERSFFDLLEIYNAPEQCPFKDGKTRIFFLEKIFAVGRWSLLAINTSPNYNCAIDLREFIEVHKQMKKEKLEPIYVAESKEYVAFIYGNKEVEKYIAYFEKEDKQVDLQNIIRPGYPARITISSEVLFNILRISQELKLKAENEEVIFETKDIEIKPKHAVSEGLGNVYFDAQKAYNLLKRIDPVDYKTTYVFLGTQELK